MTVYFSTDNNLRQLSPAQTVNVEIKIVPDTPRMQLSKEPLIVEGVKVEWCSKAMRASINAWAAQFYGGTPAIPDGCYQPDGQRVRMSARTFEQLKRNRMKLGWTARQAGAKSEVGCDPVRP